MFSEVFLHSKTDMVTFYLINDLSLGGHKTTCAFGTV